MFDAPNIDNIGNKNARNSIICLFFIYLISYGLKTFPLRALTTLFNVLAFSFISE